MSDLRTYRTMLDLLGALHRCHSTSELAVVLRGDPARSVAADPALRGLLTAHVAAARDHVRLRSLHDGQRLTAAPAPLTAREAEVLDLLRAGLSNQQIASRLWVGRRTVEKHLERLYAKLGVRNRTAAALTARDTG